jgi:hypothetical protein
MTLHIALGDQLMQGTNKGMQQGYSKVQFGLLTAANAAMRSIYKDTAKATRCAGCPSSTDKHRSSPQVTSAADKHALTC